MISKVACIIPLAPGDGRPPKPAGLKVRAPGSPGYLRLQRELQLHTVCENAHCLNIGINGGEVTPSMHWDRWGVMACDG